MSCMLSGSSTRNQDVEDCFVLQFVYAVLWIPWSNMLCTAGEIAFICMPLPMCYWNAGSTVQLVQPGLWA